MNNLLAKPWVYDQFQSLIGGKNARRYVLDRYVIPFLVNKNSMLDIGCGTGYILDYLPNSSRIDYLGYDLDPKYIQYARQKYGLRGSFINDRVNTMNLPNDAQFDFILAMGLLHHLDDGESIELLKLAQSCLAPGGRMIFLDGVFTNDQSNWAKFILSRDRGKFVRTKDEYLKSVKKYLNIEQWEIPEKLFNIPYTCLIMVCSKK